MSTIAWTPLIAQGSESGASTAAIVTFSIYLVAVMVLAWLSNQMLQSKSFMSEYFLGSRSLGMWAFALTFAATSASGGSFIGFPSLVYTHGWIVALWIGSYMIVPIVSMGLLAKRINQVARKTGAITIPDVMRDRFESPAFGALSTTLIVFFMAFNLVAQFKGGSVILQSLVQDIPLFQTASASLANAVEGVPILGASASNPGYLLCLFVFAFAVVIYTAYGGFRAVVWTDVMQGFVMIGGVMIMLPLALWGVGGLAGVTQEMAQMTPPRQVDLRLHLADPIAAGTATLGIPANSWIAGQPTESGETRLFRTAVRAQIESGQRVAHVVGSDKVHAVRGIEITYAPHREGVTFNPALQGILGSPLRRLKLHVMRQSQDETTEAGAIPIPTGSRLRCRLPDAGETWVTTLTPAEIPAGQDQARLVTSTRDETHQAASHDIAAEELGIIDDGDIANVITGCVAEVVSITDHAPLAYGDYRGTYVRGPGLHSTDKSGFLPISLAISFFFMWTFSGAGQPSNMVRLMAFQDSNTLRRAIFTVSIYYTMIYLPLVIIFCCARVLLPGWETESDRIMPEMARVTTEMAGMPWLAGLLVAAPFAAVMSTMDSFLLMIASAVVRDIYQRNMNPNASEKTIKRLSYGVTVGIGGAAMLAAVNPPPFLQDIIVFTGSGLSTSFLFPVALMLYWPRINLAGAAAGMLGGFGAHVALYAVGTYLAGGAVTAYSPFGFHPFMVGLTVSLVATVGVAYATPPPPRHLVRKFFMVNGGRTNG